ncbi:MAG: DUF397 domain-containing protein [Pseudonocardiales bacterium]
MRSSELAHVTWRKSSRTNGGVDGNCVEVAELADQVAMRDSKDPVGPVLAFPRTQWGVFLGGVRAGQLA